MQKEKVQEVLHLDHHKTENISDNSIISTDKNKCKMMAEAAEILLRMMDAYD
jgi:ribosomal silencing factor RsfS